ncbi:hypothetical protein PPYR_13035 [Photinus pyralis]|uniref:non-specific serine/threonine protein kinase n=2 Tax=Photinus pyralis TaxID=7054 RepID=A0A5N4A7Y5_PHOPY|nr:ovarian-specific serine/threonine-protein kinase Lok-like [Photinus pyralis]KAB0793415.1 hypothetical protein PPYR_13035 [Photinus pyralis]
MTSGGIQLADTQTPVDCGTFQSQEIQKATKIYGRLSSCTVYLHSIVLDKPRYVLGRGIDCDLVIHPSNFPPLSIKSVSKYHFELVCDKDERVYINDLSKNGTFINSQRVSKGCRRALYHGDQIAIGTSSLRIYVYKENDKILDLPAELKGYKILRQLGSGSYGEVWLAVQTTTNKEYAIKKVIRRNENQPNNGNDSWRMDNEVRILQSIEHPCIIGIKEVVNTDDAVFMVLEYMGGGELSSLMYASNSPLPENVVKPIFYQLLLGIRYLHLRNITHRDIKPANILLQSHQLPPIVKIADFGLSKLIESTSHMQTVCGTLAFVAPEIIDPCYGPYTQQVDVWSLGVVLYAMLSNKLPFNAAEDGDIRKTILNSQLEMVTGAWTYVSSNGKDLIKKMLMRNPEDRLTIHQVADHPWLARDKAMLEGVKQMLKDNTCQHEPRQKKIKLE